MKSSTKKIIGIILYCVLTLGLGIIAYNLNRGRQDGQTPSTYTTIQTEKIDEDDFSGTIIFQLSGDKTFPTTLSAHSKQSTRINYIEKLKVEIIKESSDYIKAENSEIMVIHNVSDNSIVINNKENSPTITDATLSDESYITIAKEQLQSLISETEINALRTNVDKTGDRVIISFQKLLNNFFIYEYTDPMSIIDVNLSKEGDLLQIIFHNTDLINTTIDTDIDILSQDDISNLNIYNIRSNGEIIITPSEETVQSIGEEHKYTFEDIIKNTKEVTINQISLGYKTSSEDSTYIIPIYILSGNAKLRTGEEAEATIIYPAAK